MQINLFKLGRSSATLTAAEHCHHSISYSQHYHYQGQSLAPSHAPSHAAVVKCHGSGPSAGPPSELLRYEAASDVDANTGAPLSFGTQLSH